MKIHVSEVTRQVLGIVNNVSEVQSLELQVLEVYALEVQVSEVKNSKLQVSNIETLKLQVLEVHIWDIKLPKVHVFDIHISDIQVHVLVLQKTAVVHVSEDLVTNVNETIKALQNLKTTSKEKLKQSSA